MRWRVHNYASDRAVDLLSLYSVLASSSSVDAAEARYTIGLVLATLAVNQLEKCNFAILDYTDSNAGVNWKTVGFVTIKPTGFIR